MENETTIKCSNCEQIRNLSHYKFTKDNKLKSDICKGCTTAINRANRLYKQRNSGPLGKIRRQQELDRKSVNSKKYGVTKEQYREIMASATKCEICGDDTKLLCYDHCHDIDKGIEAFRGVLCSNCNLGIGLLGDKPDNVLKAYKYLQKFYNKEITDETTI